MLVFSSEAFRCPANPQIASSHRVYNTAGVKLQLTASLLLHTRSFLAIVRSCIFFFLVRSTPSLCLNTIQTFILNVCQALTVYWTEVTNAGQTPPTCYKLKRLRECVCSHASGLRVALFSPQSWFTEVFFCVGLMFRRDCVFTWTFSRDTPTFACIQEFRPFGFVVKTALFGMTD